MIGKYDNIVRWKCQVVQLRFLVPEIPMQVALGATWCNSRALFYICKQCDAALVKMPSQVIRRLNNDPARNQSPTTPD